MPWLNDGVLSRQHVYHMIKHFKDKDRWSYEDGKYVCKLLYHGKHFVVTPGNVKTWHKDVEKLFKEKAYTSELGIDWWYEPVAKRHKGITRGMIFKVDKWLYNKIF